MKGEVAPQAKTAPTERICMITYDMDVELDWPLASNADEDQIQLQNGNNRKKTTEWSCVMDSTTTTPDNKVFFERTPPDR